MHLLASIDLFDRVIVGYHLSLRARWAEWLAAFMDAVDKRFPRGEGET